MFAGGTTLAAAAHVAGADADEYDVLERLTALHDKSLLLVDRDAQAQPRYRMLETVRQYAEERLNQAGESDEARTRHLRYYIALAEKAEPELHGSGQDGWFATFRHEQENLLAAHAWCAHAPEGGQLALRLTAASWRYWSYTAQPERGYRLAESALALADGAPDSTERCKTMLGMSRLAFAMGRYDAACTWGEQGLAMARRLDDASLAADGLRLVAAGLHATGEPGRALALFEQSADVARRIGDHARLGSALNGMGEVHRANGNLIEVESRYREVARLSRKVEDQRGTAAVVTGVACVLMGGGELSAARAALADARSARERCRVQGAGGSASPTGPMNRPDSCAYRAQRVRFGKRRSRGRSSANSACRRARGASASIRHEPGGCHAYERACKIRAAHIRRHRCGHGVGAGLDAAGARR